MPQNIELKQKVTNFDQIQDYLEEHGIGLKSVLNQRDIYYKNQNGLLKLRIYGDSGELIFYQRDENEKDRVSNYKILKVDPESAEQIFRNIFEIEIEVKKKRLLYIYKNTRIHLDDVERLGSFIELETIVSDSIDEGKSEFSQVVELLKLDLTSQLKTSYRNLLLEK